MRRSPRVRYLLILLRRYVVQGHPETVTEFLAPGTYWTMVLANASVSGPPPFTRLRVESGGRNIEQDSDLQVITLK